MPHVPAKILYYKKGTLNRRYFGILSFHLCLNIWSVGRDKGLFVCYKLFKKLYLLNYLVLLCASKFGNDRGFYLTYWSIIEATVRQERIQSEFERRMIKNDSVWRCYTVVTA